MQLKMEAMLIGPFQISKQYWKIAKEFDPSLTANGETYQNCKGPASELYSMRIMQASHSMYGST